MEAIEKLITKVIVSDNRKLDYIIKLMVDGGHRVIKSQPRPKYYILGPTVTEVHFLFNPTEQKILEWIEGFIETEQYEQIEIWEKILAEKRRLGVK